ncbi:TniQ family protein [Streptomyces sp. ISL-100]|uniref:TniQ family protein n=1 Tax=Streptomyces sp. ISL-100 TaxID=2819173 RepID=UPI0027E54083|nr:TniQ family protein [Streptomyces sp. ISL-100]
MAAGVLRTVPLAGELTASLISRVAARYGLPTAGVLRLWTCRNSPARHDGGGARADAEVVLNGAGRRVLAELCRVEPKVLARALPAFTMDDPKISTGREAGVAQARWRAAGTVAGPAAFGCRLCTARRTGQALRAVRYLPRWHRVCLRHGRWLLDADADQPLEHLDVRGVAEVVAAQRRWPGVARRAVRAGAEPEQAFAVAHAVVARWWEQALSWEQEEIWPRRLHQLAGGSVGSRLAWWRIVGRDAAIFPEVVAVAQALLEPGQLRVMAAEAQSGGSGTRWRATVPAEQRFRITQLVDEAREQLVELRGVHSGTTAEVARTLLEHLSHSADLIDQALVHTAAAAVASGVTLEEVAQWSRLPAEELAAVFALGEGED